MIERDYETISRVLYESRSIAKNFIPGDEQMTNYVIDLVTINLSKAFALEDSRFDKTAFILSTKTPMRMK